MIEVKVLKKGDTYTALSVEGHAYSGDPGFDLVCAGVSSIMTGALNGFDALDDTVKLTYSKQPFINIEILTPSELNQKLFEFVLIQLKTVEVAHPQNMKIHEKEVKS